MLGLSGTKLFAIGITSITIGMAKTGLACINLPALAIIAYFFGAKVSTGIALPIFMIGDMIGVTLYVKHVTNWKKIINLILPAVFGVFLGTFFGNIINDNQFKLAMGIMISICVLFLIHKEIKKSNNITSTLKHNNYFNIFIGVLGGFVSMVGNVATPFFSTYLLAMGYNKNELISLNALFLFFINWIKFPFHVFWWKTISWETLKFMPLVIPMVLTGSLIGYYTVKKIDEKKYRLFVIIMIAISAFYLIFQTL